jgi:signal transduction histidine kinase
LAVTLTSLGQLRQLHSSADQAAYRISQEALTNAARHGTGTADVVLDFGADELDMTITNPVLGHNGCSGGGGHGLIGMRERAALLGGSLTVQRSNGTFNVHARIPYGD